MDWAAKSPDLNHIENVWGFIKRGVYSNSLQFQAAGDLKAAIVQKWHKLDRQYLLNLVRGMQKRCLDVTEAQKRRMNHQMPFFACDPLEFAIYPIRISHSKVAFFKYFLQKIFIKNILFHITCFGALRKAEEQKNFIMTIKVSFPVTDSVQSTTFPI